MNTIEFIKAVKDAGCVFDCGIAYAEYDKEVDDLHTYLCKIGKVWVMLPKAFAWDQNMNVSGNDARMFAHFYRCGLYHENWTVGTPYTKLDVVYDYPIDETGCIIQRIPVAIKLVSGERPDKDRASLENPDVLTTVLSRLVGEARAMTKAIKTANVRAAAKEYEL